MKYYVGYHHADRTKRLTGCDPKHSRLEDPSRSLPAYDFKSRLRAEKFIHFRALAQGSSEDEYFIVEEP